ncbi:hypothetical protein GBAR_LOCUS20924, partial [Geodia barretti]
MVEAETQDKLGAVIARKITAASIMLKVSTIKQTARNKQ